MHVAPFTGAWIETSSKNQGYDVGIVAPFTGAWIETIASPVSISTRHVSLPSRGRGLKHNLWK